MGGQISAAVAWGNSPTNCDSLTGFGTCPSTKSMCDARLVSFEVSKKYVDLALDKSSGLSGPIVPAPGQLIDYTLRVDNLSYLNDTDDNPATPEQNTCYRSSGYIIEDLLPSYLKYAGVVSGLAYNGTTSTTMIPSVTCVDAGGNTITCDYGSITQIKVQNNLPTISTPEPNINTPIAATTCAVQYHVITLRVMYDDSNPRDVAPASIYNYACVNGFQYDPWGGARQDVDPATGLPIVIPAYGNNCDDDNVITEVDLVAFNAHPQENGILVEWETASEKDNLGFNLYRATSPEGERTKLNATLIPSFSPGGNLGATYTYTDTFDLQPNTVYYYWLEDLDMSGKLTLHGPVSTQSQGMLLPFRIFLPSIRGGN